MDNMFGSYIDENNLQNILTNNGCEKREQASDIDREAIIDHLSVN